MLRSWIAYILAHAHYSWWAHAKAVYLPLLRPWPAPVKAMYLPHVKAVYPPIQVVQLMGVDLLRQQPRWKEGLMDIRQLMANLTQQVTTMCTQHAPLVYPACTAVYQHAPLTNPACTTHVLTIHCLHFLNLLSLPTCVASIRSIVTTDQLSSIEW